MLLCAESENNVCTSRFEYDDIGNPVLYRGLRMDWGRLRNLMQVDGGRIAFGYDASGMRTDKVCAEANQTSSSRYYYHEGRLIAEKRRARSCDLQVGDYLEPGYSYKQEVVIGYLYGANGLTALPQSR